MTISWKDIEESWTPSTGAKRIVDQTTLFAVVNLLEHVASKDRSPPDVNLFGRPGVGRTHMQLIEKDQLSTREFCGEFAKQLKLHGCLWQSHIDDKFRDVYESFFVFKEGEALRYCKVAFAKKGSPLKCKTNLTSIQIDYHLTDNEDRKGG